MGSLSHPLCCLPQALYPYARASTGRYSFTNSTCENAVLASSVAASSNVTTPIQSLGQGAGALEPLENCTGQNGNLYKTLSQNDPLAWGAAWLFYATGDPAYYMDLSRFYTLFQAEAQVRSSNHRICAMGYSLCNACDLMKHIGARA